MAIGRARTAFIFWVIISWQARITGIIKLTAGCTTFGARLAFVSPEPVATFAIRAKVEGGAIFAVAAALVALVSAQKKSQLTIFAQSRVCGALLAC